MDTSIRLSKVQSALKASSEPNVRARIAAVEILSTAKPYMTYLSGFAPMKDLISFTDGLTPWDAGKWEFAEYTHIFPKDISLDTWVRRVEILVDLKGTSGRKTARRVYEKRWSYQKIILITRSCDVLVWDLAIRYQRKGKKRTAAVRSKFRVLRWKSLSTYLDNPRIGRAMTTNIGWCVTDTIEDRKRRLVATEELDIFIRSVESLLAPR